MIKKSLIWDKGMCYMPLFMFGCIRGTRGNFGIQKTEHGTRYTIHKAGRREFDMSMEIQRKVRAAYE